MTEQKNEVLQKRDSDWLAVLWYIHLHALGAYGLWLIFVEAQWLTTIFTLFLIILSSLGVTVGAHRLWAHETFTASFPVRFFLVMAHTLAGVGPIYDWVLYHRIHHKYYKTDKDPYNHKKGLWYSHVIANLLALPPNHEELEKSIDMRVVESDGLVWVQRKFYWILFIIFGLLLPVNTPAEYWGESLKTSIFILCFFRLAVTCNIAWLINSAMLVWGLEPGAKFPVDDNSVFFLNKSYWINYHYLLPWDVNSGEFGTYDSGFGSLIIKLWNELGLINRLKSPTTENIRETLHKLATAKTDVDEVLSELKETVETQAKMIDLQYKH
ncbi:acyl-CoA Delta-9 desaturase [Prorops nasuta]|uniref:acyl-CoA Delta-9 desaturase n=1 Tax=Prorops nasuta TaxID=863751 RepID=UPI0034CDBB9E